MIRFPPSNVTVEILDARTGRLTGIRRARNHIVATGRNRFRDLIAGRGKGPEWIALGTAESLPNVDERTALGAEYYRAAVTAVRKQESRLTFETVVGVTEANGQTYKELGLFAGTDWGSALCPIASALGVLIADAQLSAFEKTDQKILVITWDVVIKYQTIRV